jgi:hypothetical protein
MSVTSKTQIKNAEKLVEMVKGISSVPKLLL